MAGSEQAPWPHTRKPTVMERDHPRDVPRLLACRERSPTPARRSEMILPLLAREPSWDSIAGQLIVRNLEDGVIEALKRLASNPHGRSRNRGSAAKEQESRESREENRNTPGSHSGDLRSTYNFREGFRSRASALPPRRSDAVQRLGHDPAASTARKNAGDGIRVAAVPGMITREATGLGRTRHGIRTATHRRSPI